MTLIQPTSSIALNSTPVTMRAYSCCTNKAAPISHVAELVGADTDSEQAIRWLIALMVMCCDPLAITLTGCRKGEEIGGIPAAEAG
jgi:hypothetical protein